MHMKRRFRTSLFFNDLSIDSMFCYACEVYIIKAIQKNKSLYDEVKTLFSFVVGFE